MDFAIIETGGKQFKITPELDFVVEKLTGKAGDKIVFDKVIMIVDGEKVEIGSPYIEGATFEAEIVDQTKGKKIHVRRFKAKSRYRRHIGHRQQLTVAKLEGKKEKPAKKTAKKTAKKENVEKKTSKKVEVKKTESKKVVAKKPIVKKTVKKAEK